MTLTIELTPEQQARLAEAAQQEGVQVNKLHNMRFFKRDFQSSRVPSVYLMSRFVAL